MLVAALNEICATIHLLVAHFCVGGNIDAPLGRVLTEEEIQARTRLVRRDPAIDRLPRGVEAAKRKMYAKCTSA